MSASQIVNREHWLTEMARLTEPLFKGFSFAPYRVTCGWPCRGATGKARRIGECHYPQQDGKGSHEIFISPTLDEVPDVVGTLAHEMAHVLAGLGAAHGKGFVRVCRHVGLTRGKPGSVGPGESLAAVLAKLSEKLGPYPHVAIKPALRPTKPASSVGLTCPTCEYGVTISRKALEEFGPPTCSCGKAFQPKER